MRRRIAAAALGALLSLGLVAGIGGIGGITGSGLVGGGLVEPAGAQAGPPSAEPATDLRADKLNGPFLEDSTPGRAAAIPMAVAGVAIFGIVVALVVKSRRGAHERSR